MYSQMVSAIGTGLEKALPLLDLYFFLKRASRCFHVQGRRWGPLISERVDIGLPFRTHVHRNHRAHFSGQIWT